MFFCPCGSKKFFGSCCEPILAGKKIADTAEQLMRARYCAYAKGSLEFLKRSLHPAKRQDYDEDASKKWSTEAKWKGLEILSMEKGGVGAPQGFVDFVAHYQSSGKDCEHRERAEFRRVDGRWFFYDGQLLGGAPVKRDTPKLGRNDLCSCGSGKKFKKCCGA